jgi:galactonate dehydratase
MRVRGFFGGFYHDALAAVDIALWDAKGKLLGLSICDMLGGKHRSKLRAYVSGLPARTLKERVAMAKEWISKGFTAVKFASAVSHEGILEEMAALREALGYEVKILVDLHWKYTAAEAIQMINKLEEYDLYVAEAPVKPEDIEGQALVARSVRTQVAIGEELRTVFEFRPRLERRCMNIIQPELGRTGITSFWRICQIAQAFNVAVMPHASIGIGVFQAASLQVSVALNDLLYHEYQHSIFNKNLKYISGNMDCESGFFHLPGGSGLGVEPTDEVYKFVKQWGG